MKLIPVSDAITHVLAQMIRESGTERLCAQGVGRTLGWHVGAGTGSDDWRARLWEMLSGSDAGFPIQCVPTIVGICVYHGDARRMDSLVDQAKRDSRRSREINWLFEQAVQSGSTSQRA